MRETPSKYKNNIIVGGVAHTEISLRWGRPREIQRPYRALPVTVSNLSTWSRSTDWHLRKLERVFVDFVALTMNGHGADAAQPNGHEVQQSGRQADEFLKKVLLWFSATAGALLKVQSK